VLGIKSKHPIVETLWAIHKFSIVVLERPYNWFLLSPSDNIASNHKFGSRYGWVKRSSFYLSLTGCYMYHEKKVSKVLSSTIHEPLHPFFYDHWSLHVHFHKKSLIELGLRPIIVAYKKKLLLVKYIF
jgi:hypothetical protein